MIVKILTSLMMILATINIRFGFFSLPDIILAIFLAYLILFKKNIYLSRNVIFTIIIFISLYFLSAQFSGYSNFNGEINFYGFLFKYIFIISLFIIFTNIAIDENFLYKLVLICWLILAAWAIYYAFFLIGNPLLSILIPSQISFPGTGSGDSINSDSHLYAYVFGSLGLYLILFSSNFKKLAFFLTTLFIILLTGSRNPLALFGVLLVFYFFNSRIEKKFFVVFLVLLAVPFIASQLYLLEEILPSMRSFQFDFANDSSAGNRIKKLLLALEEYKQGSLFLGQSSFGTSMTWVDGIHTILLIHFGPFGLIIYLTWLSYFLIKLYFLSLRGSERSLKILYLSIYIFLGLFITEFILVSRGAALVLIPLIVLTTNLNNNFNSQRL
jgi:hypothetical protein